MSPFDGAKCVGLSWLFDSTDARDHHDAKRRCDTCPALAACTERTDQLAADIPAGRCYATSMVGTWAGQLYGAHRPRGRHRYPREHGTDRGYGQHRWADEVACEPCRLAHAERERTRKVRAA